jgi:hypothetical protein
VGQAPPRDAPPPSQQAAVNADAGFGPSPSGSALCGFPFPIGFTNSLAFVLPKFPPAIFPLTLNYFLAFQCDLSQPLTGSFGFGGGRVSQQDADADPEYGEGLTDTD